MKKLCLLLVSLMVCSLSEAQTWYNANVGGVLFGQGWTSEVGTKYQRFPDRASSLVPSGVWSLSKNTAGLNVRFVTNAKTITVKNPKSLKATASKLYAGKYYYVRIRTYKNIAKANYFSAWSKTYKVKTK